MAHMPATNMPPGLSFYPVASVKDYGAKGDGATDDTDAIQEAVDASATAGRALLFPRGTYRVDSTIIIDSRCHRLVGEFGGRASFGGTEIVFYGTGPCFQIGTDDSVDWDASHYGGADSEQDQTFENLWLSHASPATSLAGGGQYKAGAYGIWDWYGGGTILRNVGIEEFEANFVGIQSDINSFEDITSLYSKYGLYFGPRSDQATIHRLYSYGCDRVITVDRANGMRIVDPQIVGCGSATVSPIEVRRGSARVSIVRPWLESFNGYSGTDQISYVSVGEVDGYGAGGSISSAGGAPTTSACDGVYISDPFVYAAAAAQSYHTKYIATVGKCRRFVLDHPIAPVGASLSNLDALVAVPAAQTPTSTDTQIRIAGVNSNTTLASIYTNLGAGTPAWHIETTGQSGAKMYGSSDYAIENGSLILNRNDGGSHASRPIARIKNTATGGGFAHRSDLELEGEDAGGTVRTAVVRGEGGLLQLLSANNQNINLNAGSGAINHIGIFATAGEISPAQITGDQNNYNPTGLSTAIVMFLTSDASRNITGITSLSWSGRHLYVRNVGAQDIVLVHDSGSSSTANKMLLRASGNVTMTPGTGVHLYWSASAGKWQQIGTL